jgi:acylphosphatase
VLAIDFKPFISPNFMNYLNLRLIGRVQGVGLRMLIFSQARKRNIGGWVKNESDGSVSVHLEGDNDELEEFASWLSGINDPFGASVQIVKREGSGRFDGPKRQFEIKL